MFEIIIGYIITYVSTYYCLDLISMICGFRGLQLFSHGDRNKEGFIYMAIAAMCALVVAFISLQFGFIMANSINIYLAYAGYKKIKQKNKE